MAPVFCLGKPSQMWPWEMEPKPSTAPHCLLREAESRGLAAEAAGICAVLRVLGNREAQGLPDSGWCKAES